MKIAPARVAAFDVLLRIERDRAYSSVLLPLYEDGLSAPDRGLCHALVLGTLRRQMYLDRLIDELSSSKTLDTEIRVSLRLGLYQLRFLDRIPAHSAVSESVDLVQRAKKTSAKGFVNAILRRAARERIEPSYSDEIDRLSSETSHPRWLVERWVDQFGLAEATSLLAANNEPPGFAFRYLRDDRPVIEGARASEFVEGCFFLDRVPGDPAAFAAANDVYFQDEGSQLVADAVQVPENGRFLDVCAAPGGKTGYIAKHCRTGLSVAGDVHWQRLLTLRETCRRQYVDADIVQYDASGPLPFADGSFGSVFVDAPCSGTGTIRHNPEIRYFLHHSDIAALAEKQLAILTFASKMVVPGGRLFYSTCSLEREENEAVCQKFMTSDGRFEPVAPVENGRFITSDGFARTFPHRDNMDGFFLVSMRRSPDA